jgi:hypothetical protein
LVLIITIIIIIILAGAVILSLASNNPISQASQAVFLNDVRNFQSELALYHGKQFAATLGNYNAKLLQADETSVTYGSEVDSSKNIYDLIPTLGSSNKYVGEFEVIDGELVYKGNDDNRKDWASEIGVPVISINSISVIIFPPTLPVIQPGEEVSYLVKFSSNSAIKTLDYANKFEVVDETETALPLQPYMNITSVTGDETSTTRELQVTITTSSLPVGEYKIRLKAGIATDINGKTNKDDITSTYSFEVVDTSPPDNPVISASPTGWTNGNVTVIIEYSEDTTTKEYSFDAISWNIYTGPVSVNTNNTTVYARGFDAASNESGVSSITISNIDNVPPTVTVSEGGKTTSSVTITASASDAQSGLNVASYQYSIDDGVSWTNATNLTSYTFNALTSGTYTCRVKVSDLAGNVGISSAISITTSSLGTISLSSSPTGWTNGSVSVTITYPAEVVTKQYSLNGTNWNTYTTPITVTDNGVTVFAKGLDATGNQTAQASITVSNIDKTAPTVSFGTNGGTNPTVASTTVTVSDTGGSGVNASTLQYYWDTQDVTTPSSGWLTFTNGSSLSKSGTGNYYLWIRAYDNAGNIVTAKSNKFTIGDVETIVSTPQTTNKTYSGATSGFTFRNPVIPAGFVAVNTSTASWDKLSTDWGKGLVIQDAYGNQFVWVPVDGNDVPYAKKDYKGSSYLGLSDASLPSGFSETKITNTYQGFYIGRYEASFDYNGGNIRAAVKKATNATYDDWSTTRNALYNGYVWNYISGADAKYHAENMAYMYGYDTSKVITNLVTPQEWDATLEWLKWYSYSGYESRNWGNYEDSTSPANVSGYSMLQPTGYSTAWRANNIYDLAGNFSEFTNEIYFSTWYVHRGGSAQTSGYYDPAGVRGYANGVPPAYVFDRITFRVALFVK